MIAAPRRVHSGSNFPTDHQLVDAPEVGGDSVRVRKREREVGRFSVCGTTSLPASRSKISLNDLAHSSTIALIQAWLDLGYNIQEVSPHSIFFISFYLGHSWLCHPLLDCFHLQSSGVHRYDRECRALPNETAASIPVDREDRGCEKS